MRKIMHSILTKAIGAIAFVKVLLKAPLSTGMICPSSPFLTTKLASQISDEVVNSLRGQVTAEKNKRTKDLDANSLSEQACEKTAVSDQSECPQGYVVELGAGTGAVTKALLKRGIPPSRLLVFERSETMASLLTARFPGIRIIQDDAANLAQYIPKNGKISAIVSSLPFVSLPTTVSDNIIAAMQDSLGNSPLIQYTYALNQKTLLEEKGFMVAAKQTVWLNLPPAAVLIYNYYQ